MAAKINWHRYGTKLRHCHRMYSAETQLDYNAFHARRRHSTFEVQLSGTSALFELGNT